FSVAYHLKRRGYLPLAEQAHLEWVLATLEQDLPVPRRRLTRDMKDRAIFWLRAEWTCFAEPLRQLSGVLVRAGYKVELLSTTHPGYVEYTDLYQVGAIPFRDTYDRRVEKDYLTPWLGPNIWRIA